MKKAILACAVLMAGTAPVVANQYESAMRGYHEEQISQWATDPVLVAAIKAQNAETMGIDQAEIDKLDARWRSGLYAENEPLIEGVLSNAAADYLRERVAQSGGAITEVFIMDAQGLNVAASDATSDYWQGDEAKFQQTYPLGANSVHFGDIELDDSTGAVQGQISMSIVDTETGFVVGAITVGVNLSALQ